MTERPNARTCIRRVLLAPRSCRGDWPQFYFVRPYAVYLGSGPAALPVPLPRGRVRRDLRLDTPWSMRGATPSSTNTSTDTVSDVGTSSEAPPGSPEPSSREHGPTGPKGQGAGGAAAKPRPTRRKLSKHVSPLRRLIAALLETCACGMWQRASPACGAWVPSTHVCLALLPPRCLAGRAGLCLDQGRRLAAVSGTGCGEKGWRGAWVLGRARRLAGFAGRARPMPGTHRAA